MITIEDDNRNKQYDFLTLDKQRFENWFLSVSDCEAFERLKALLEKMMSLWNNRISSIIGASSASKICSILALHGVPFRLHRIHKGGHYHRFHFYLKYLPRTNLMEIFNQISILEGGYREMLWAQEHLQIRHNIFAPNVRLSLRNSHRLQRYTLWKMAASLNYRAVAVYLSNSPVFRSIRIYYVHESYCRYITTFFDLPIYALMALHVVVSNTRRLVTFRSVSDRIYQLSNLLTISHVSIVTENCILAYLMEFLTTALVQGSFDTIDKIISLERDIHRLSMTAKFKTPWRAYHSIARFCKWKNNVSHESANMIARNLFETLESDLSPEVSFLWVDAILFVSSTADTGEDDIAEVIEKCSESPLLATLLARRLRSIDKTDELRLLAEQVCSADNSLIHPSDDLWLDWTEERIKTPQRRGMDVLNHCVEKLFNFLDYGSNRSNDRAWFLLWSGVQLVSPDFLQSLWEERKSWWLRFHTITLSTKADSARSEVLSALVNELI